jgi:hypothetical protein
MRYYLYISDAKVDMLLPQVPGATQQKISAKFGFDIKLFSGSLASERNTLDNRIARLEAVEAFLRDSVQLGTPEEPKSWIAGTVDAKVVDADDGCVLFVAGNEAWMVGLGGSMRHVIGMTSIEGVRTGFSFMPSIVGTLMKVVEEPDFFSHLNDEQMEFYVTSGRSQGFRTWTNALDMAYEKAKNPAQRIEFVGKRLATGTTYRNCLVTLATPLYVAAVD